LKQEILKNQLKTVDAANVRHHASQLAKPLAVLQTSSVKTQISNTANAAL